jgi:hypothetical protein
MNYILFDRHANMSPETLFEIGKIISEIEINYDRNKTFELVNMLYGLYDGYLYEDLLPIASVLLTNEEFVRLAEVITVVQTYPQIIE